MFFPVLHQRGVQALGAVDLSLPLAAGKDLSVKEYNGGIWASYQSPSANQILRELNQALRALGFSKVADDGVIRAVNVEAVKLVASFAGAPGYAGLSLPSGGTAGYAGTALRRYTTAKALAKGGVEARYYVRSLVESSYFKTLMQSALTNRPLPAPPAPAPTPTSPPVATVPNIPPPPANAPVYVPPGVEPKPTFFARYPNAPYAIGGGILLAGLGFAAYLVWQD